jgi:hypothetical protein
MKTWELAKKHEFKVANLEFQAPLSSYPFLATACNSSFIAANQKAIFYDRLPRQQSGFSADLSQRSRNLNNGNCDLITGKLCDMTRMMTAHSSDPVPWSDLE